MMQAIKQKLFQQEKVMGCATLVLLLFHSTTTACVSSVIGVGDRTSVPYLATLCTLGAKPTQHHPKRSRSARYPK